MAPNLNLIPGSNKEFKDKEYWDKFFKIRGTKAFEWYGEYENLCDVIHKYIKLNDKVLVIGCGNSKLSETMYDVGIKNIVNIDLVESLIQQMAIKNKSRTAMKWLKMDMLKMDFDDNQFETVLDKGTLDALMSSEANIDSDKLFEEIDRVLNVGGKYVCISLAQDHILSKLLSSFINKGWIIRIHRINEQDLDFYLPVFVFVFTKMKMKISPQNPIIELKLEINSDQFIRTSTIEDTKAKIKEYQNYGLTKFYISNNNVDIEDEVFVHLYDGSNQKYPRFTIYISDMPTVKGRLNGKFAAFVVPIGKELEWHFGTKLGRQELVSQAKYQRLAIVYLNRAHHYDNLDSILAELSPKIIELAPKDIPVGYKIPMLSMGADLDVRDIKFKGSSKISGDFFVEDVMSTEQNELTRRLVFQSIIPTVQTEVILKPFGKYFDLFYMMDSLNLLKHYEEDKLKKKKNKNDLRPSYNYFMDDYFSMVLAQLCSLKQLNQGKKTSILLIGLGGGALAMYCKTWLKDALMNDIEIDAVDIDEEIAKCAKEWFGLSDDVNIHIGDGLEYIRNAAKSDKKWDIVIIDVNSNDAESDLWVPTYDFVELEFLKDCGKILAHPNGLFIMNMICLKKSVKDTILERLNVVWPHTFLNKLEKNRNEVVFCMQIKKEEMFIEKLSTRAPKDKNNNKIGSTLSFLEEISIKLKEINL